MKLLLALLLCFSAVSYGMAHECSLPPSSKVYDCFMFNNELDILEIRLNEMSPYVDYFVLVEWNRGHRVNNLTRFYFEENKERFAEFLPKIIHIKLDEVIEAEDAWVRENYHRNQIMRGLVNCAPEDVILISDVDEIIPGNVIPQVIASLSTVEKLGFWQTLYRWFLNRKDDFVWAGTIAIKYGDLKKASPQQLRNASRTILDMPRLRAGWHFTAMGGFDSMQEKYYSIVEGSDCQFPSRTAWLKHVDQNTTAVPIDSSYPKFIQENKDYLVELDLIDNR